MLQSPETELLLLCARPQLDSAAASRTLSLVQRQPDWDLIFQLADYYRTIPLLAHHLRDLATDLLPGDVQAELHRHHKNTTHHNMALAVEVLRVVDLFSASAIPVVPFKGPVSAVLVYNDMAMRACGDIDLLVKESDHDHAERLLKNEGYVVERRFNSAMQSSLWDEKRRINIDLHWGIPPRKMRLDSARLWETLEPVNLLGRPVLSFSRYDTLLVMAINAVKEYQKPSLHHLSDIAALTRDFSESDWLATFERARAVGCQRMLVAAVLFTHRMLESPLPAVGPRRLFNDRQINTAIAKLHGHLFPEVVEQNDEECSGPAHYAETRAYYAALADSSWRRRRDWLKRVVTPNMADRNFVRLPTMLSFLYVVIRPLRLLKKYL